MLQQNKMHTKTKNHQKTNHIDIKHFKRELNITLKNNTI